MMKKFIKLLLVLVLTLQVNVVKAEQVKQDFHEGSKYDVQIGKKDLPMALGDEYPTVNLSDIYYYGDGYYAIDIYYDTLVDYAYIGMQEEYSCEYYYFDNAIYYGDYATVLIPLNVFYNGAINYILEDIVICVGGEELHYTPNDYPCIGINLEIDSVYLFQNDLLINGDIDLNKGKTLEVDFYFNNSQILDYGSDYYVTIYDYTNNTYLYYELYKGIYEHNYYSLIDLSQWHNGSYEIMGVSCYDLDGHYCYARYEQFINVSNATTTAVTVKNVSTVESLDDGNYSVSITFSKPVIGESILYILDENDEIYNCYYYVDEPSYTVEYIINQDFSKISGTYRLLSVDAYTESQHVNYYFDEVNTFEHIYNIPYASHYELYQNGKLVTSDTLDLNVSNKATIYAYLENANYIDETKPINIFIDGTSNNGSNTSSIILPATKVKTGVYAIELDLAQLENGNYTITMVSGKTISGDHFSWNAESYSFDIIHAVNNYFYIVKSTGFKLNSNGDYEITLTFNRNMDESSIRLDNDDYENIYTEGTKNSDNSFTYIIKGSREAKEGLYNFDFIYGGKGDIAYYIVETQSTFNFVRTKPAAHDLVKSEATVTCTEPGYPEYYYCEDCYAYFRDSEGKIEIEDVEEIPALGHDYIETVIKPTTTAKGYTLHTCSRCGDSYKDHYVDPIQKPTESVTDKFSDVGKGQWYVEYIQYAVDKGLMNGYTGTTSFKPEESVTREMMVQVLYNMAGKPKVIDHTATSLFWDVYEGAWFEEAVCWAYNNGITTGMDGGFGTGKNMTREQMVRFLRNYAKEAGLDVTSNTSINSYPDYKEVDDWAKEDMAWGVATGMISGVTLDNVNYLQPLGNATRAQLATVLTRYCNYYNL